MIGSIHCHRRGSSLIEVLVISGVVIAIAAIVLAVYIGLGTNKRHLATLDQLDLIHQKLEMFQTDMGRWPRQVEGLDVLWNAGAITPVSDQGRWNGPYIDQQHLIDIWGNSWVYNSPDTRNSEYMLLSLGHDHTHGTPDDLGIPMSQVIDAD